MAKKTTSHKELAKALEAAGLYVDPDEEHNGVSHVYFYRSDKSPRLEIIGDHVAKLYPLRRF